VKAPDHDRDPSSALRGKAPAHAERPQYIEAAATKRVGCPELFDKSFDLAFAADDVADGTTDFAIDEVLAGVVGPSREAIIEQLGTLGGPSSTNLGGMYHPTSSCAHVVDVRLRSHKRD